MSPSVSFAVETSTPQRRTSIYSSSIKKQKMSLTQTYFLAHSARGKLSREAAKGDHNLRRLVGHANMLDSLMIDLASAEQEQGRWFNNSLTEAKEEIEHEAPITEEPEWEADQESSDEEEEISSIEDMEVDEDEHIGELSLQRTQSRNTSPPPPPLERSHSDSEEESSDDEMPPSPTQLNIHDFAYLPKDQIAMTQQPIIIAAY
ncbi:hypothetical protein LTR66_017731 [Elasticomyces elasticus]|nr:hypothetical protein LTR66_017731 [Elasticomyces elasticus]